MNRVVPILMPQAGNSMEEGTIRAWHVKEGDRVRAGQVVCDIETDKATVEVEAAEAGRMGKIVAPVGAVVPVKEAIAYLAESAAEVEEYLAIKSETRNSKSEVRDLKNEAPVRVSRHEPMRVSPAARRFAKERGIDLGSLPPGRGPKGRLLSTDVPERGTGGVVVLRETVVTEGWRGKKVVDVVDRAVGVALEGMVAPKVVHLDVEEFWMPAPLKTEGFVFLAVGGVREGVIARGGVMIATHVMTVTLSVDEGMADAAAGFLKRLKATLEKEEFRGRTLV